MLTAMRSTRLIFPVLLLLAFAGCAAQPDGNASACASFAKLNNHWASIERDSTVSESARLTFRHGYRTAIDDLALHTSGDVKLRLTALVTAMPADATTMLLSGALTYDAYVSNSGLVADACKAAGATIRLDTVR